ncbi:hypothetical protein B5X24_HaOG210684 [Helicoverpa armigera]|uniref:Fanconi Anaemia group E protein C-terminal domain-containing protein n=1 Tax=Helicoverpa armigera TaxID=29058 RepID=A0A2W1BHS2_HELAM|nr:hypothetical protein B5X24_HaOG210684 [Helicoverpa armigera]
MSYIWTFAPESKALLQSCLNAAGPQDESNKWFQKFGPQNLDLINKTIDTIVVNDSPEIDDKPATQENQDEDILNAAQEFLDPEIDIISKFGDLVENCKKTPKLLEDLAKNLPTATAEKLFKHILDTKDISRDFLTIFYKYFTPHYIRRENSRFCTEILLETYKKYPVHFKLAFKVILKDLEVQNTVVNDFILHLEPKNLTDLLEFISDLQLSSEQFCHNLFTILTAYKTCNKTDIIQNYILSYLKTYPDTCSSDKNFGKLMLAYLQNEKACKNKIDCELLEGIVERHKSPFKRPCLSILKEIKDGNL